MVRDKIKSRKELEKLCRHFRSQEKKIGFTSGAFDLLHAGHTDYLEVAKSYCDILIVGINSDASVKRYKGKNRPIIPEYNRLKMVAALESVDYVFPFNERRNEKNITILKPDLYFKAGDYSPNQLTSKPVIEKLGGKVMLIPIVEDVSTTSIISQISTTSGNVDAYIEEAEKTGHFERRPAKVQPAIFLDRDGTINKDYGYLSEPDKFELLPYALDGMKKMSDMGYRLVIITNQGGIGLGYYEKEDFYKVNRKMLIDMSNAHIHIDKILFCPHSRADHCSCRKPEIGLIKRAQKDLNIDLTNSYFIGDSEVDIEAGKRAGTKTILILGDFESDFAGWKFKPDFIADNLLEAANIILNEERK